MLCVPMVRVNVDSLGILRTHHYVDIIGGETMAYRKDERPLFNLMETLLFVLAIPMILLIVWLSDLMRGNK